MSKLVQVIKGEVFDVIVDTRLESPTFGQWQGVRLSGDECLQLYVPRQFLHGFLALSDEVVFYYMQSAEYDPSQEIGVRWDDPDLGIAWPAGVPPLVSQRDCDNEGFQKVFAHK